MEQPDGIRPLVEESARGNTDSFRALYTHLIKRVFAYLRYRSGSEDDALDLAQDVFVDLFKALSSFSYRTPEQFYAFVFVITKRKLAAYYADKHTKSAVQSSMPDEGTIAAPSSNVETVHDVQRALMELEDDTREIVILYHWSRYTFGEIATMLHMTETAVRVRHHRALKTLSGILEDTHYGSV